MSDVINIDGSDYNFSDLEQDAQFCVRHIASIQNEMEMLKMKYEQLEAAKSVFSEKLRQSIPEKKLGEANGS